MTPLPKRRLSRSRQGKRQRDIKITLAGLSPCQNCHQPKLPHQICPNCGYYNGKKIIKK